MTSAPSHPALDSLHMEKTPRRSSPPAGSVVVDPTSQLPSSSGPGSSGPASSGRRASQGAPGRTGRKGEATLVLDARRVDTLRRQALEGQRVQQRGRRRQVVLWALAGAGAVLLGGWLARRLSPTVADRGDAPLLLGRNEEEGLLSPPPAPSEGSESRDRAAEADELAGPSAKASRSSVRLGSAARTYRSSDAASADPEAPAAAQEGMAETGQTSAGERSPEDPKVVGDWGDGFDSAGRPTSGKRVQRGPPPRPAPAGSDVFDLDELPTE